MGRILLKWNRGISLLPFLLISFALLLFLWNSQHNILHVLERPEHLNGPHTPSELAVDDLADVDGSVPEPPSLPIAPPIPLLYPSVPSKLTLIALWSTGDRPVMYLPNFFSSVAANPSIELLFIKFDVHNKGGCQKAMAAEYPNIREVCLSVDEYWDLHADFLCSQWGCSSDDRTKLAEKLLERAKTDGVCGYVSRLQIRADPASLRSTRTSVLSGQPSSGSGFTQRRKYG